MKTKTFWLVSICCLFLLLPRSLHSQTIIPSGTISTNTTWDLSGSPFLVSCGGVTIAAGVTLTISPGVSVQFNVNQFNGQSSILVSGSLIANGTSLQKILFTSILESTGTASPGNWEAIVFNTGATGSISNAVVRYGGGAVGPVPAPLGGISIQTGNSSPDLQNNVITSSGTAGIDVEAGSPSISGNMMANNSAGLRLRNCSAIVSGNTLQNNFSVAIDSDLDSSGGFSGNTATNNGTNGVVIQESSGFSTGKSATWAQTTMPYVLITAGVFNERVFVTAGSTLTIAAGVVVKLQDIPGPGQGVIGKTTLVVNGTLTADGTAAPIYFTALSDDSVGGDTNNDGPSNTPAGNIWGMISFEAGSSGTLKNVTIRHAFTGVQLASNVAVTGNIVSSNLTGISVGGGSHPQLSLNTVQNNGIGIDANQDNAAIDHNTFDGDRIGIRLQSSGASVTNNVFHNNSQQPISTDLDSSGGFSGNTATNNETNGVVIQKLSALSTGKNVTWAQTTMPYVLITAGVFNERVFITAGSALTIGPGVVVKLQDIPGPGQGVIGKTTLVVDGTLFADGTAAPINFTALSDDSVGGDTNNDGPSNTPAGNIWGMISFEAGSSGLLKNVLIRYAFTGVQISIPS